MNSNHSWFGAGQRHVWLPYTQMKTARPPLPVVSAAGARLRLADGRELIDGIASWWCVAHGYAHPHITQAIAEQAGKLPHVMLGGLAHEQPYRLASRLAALLPGDLSRVFFSESGSVSVEVAMKMAVQYHLNRGDRRTRFVSFRDGYHGDTFATMSVCDPDEGMHTMFSGVLPPQVVVPLPSTEKARQEFKAELDRVGHQVAAVIVEPLVQGAGGMIFHDAEVLKFLRAETESRGILLIFDEIFVGFGRLGTAMFACEAASIVPDIVTLSKALTGGTLPLAATVAREHVFEAFMDDDASKALMHGPTYMGNAIACAAANASLDLFESEPRLAQALAIEAVMRKKLAPLASRPGIVDVRCRGAIAVVQLQNKDRIDRLAARFAEEGVFIRPFRYVVYVTPPLAIPEDDLHALADAFAKVILEHLSA